MVIKHVRARTHTHRVKAVNLFFSELYDLVLYFFFLMNNTN